MRRRGSEAEIVDEGFWDGSGRRLPLTGSYLVDSLVLAVVILAIATVIGLAHSCGRTPPERAHAH